MKRNNRWGRSTVSVALMVLLSAGLSAQDLKILVPRTVSALPVLSLADTYLGGRKVMVEVFDDHALAMAALVTGKTDILMTGFSTGLNRWSSSSDVVHAATPVWGVSSLVALDPSLKSLGDLEGKTILVPFAGSPLEIQLKVLLDHTGMTGKVKIDYAPIPQQVPLLLQKKVDAISVPEPLVTRLKTQNGAFQVFTFAQAWSQVTGGEPRSPQVSLFVRKKEGVGRAVLEDLNKALASSLAALKIHPEAAAAKYGAILQVPAPLILGGLSNTLFDLPSGEVQKSLIEGYLRITKEVPQLPSQEFYSLP